MVFVVVVVVFFTLTDRASTIPSNIRGCQSGTWSQRGTKVNGSHHGDNPLLRPTGIQIATKIYAILQAMAPTNNNTVHQTSFTPYREQPRSTRIVVAYPRPAFSATNRTNTSQPVSINNSKFLKATHRTKIKKIKIPRSMVVEALSWWSRRANQHPAVQSPVHPWKSPMNLAGSPLHVALVGRKMTVVRDQLFPQKPPGSRFLFSRKGVQPSPGSSTIELPSASAESGAYPPKRELPGSPRQCSPCLSRAATFPKATKLELGRGAHLKTPSSANHTAAASQPTGRIAKAASWLHLSRVSPALHPPKRPSHTHTPKPGFGGRGHEICHS